MNRGLLIVIGALILIAGCMLAIGRCSVERRGAVQERQNTAGAEAYSGAATDAVNTVVKRVDEDADVDTIVNQATQEIKNADDPAAARAAVVNRVCSLHAYRDRPECAM